MHSDEPPAQAVLINNVEYQKRYIRPIRVIEREKRNWHGLHGASSKPRTALARGAGNSDNFEN